MSWRHRLGVPVAALLATGALSTALLVGAGASAGALDLSPTTSADDGGGGSLRTILETLPDDNQVVVLASGSGPYVLVCGPGGDIDLTKDVVIKANGNTIRQTCPGERIFETGAALTLDDAVVTGGRENGNGGAIRSTSTSKTLTIRNSTITGNVAWQGADGGAIASVGPVTIIDSTLSYNSAEDDAGALELKKTAVALVRNSTFVNNCAEDDAGALESDADVTIVNSTFTANTSKEKGAIEIGKGKLTLVYADVLSNVHQDGVSCPGVLGAIGAGASDAAQVTADTEVEASASGEPSNVTTGDGGVAVFGSVVALPIEVDPASTALNCDLGDGAITSSGWNYSDDDTCGFAAATDTQNGPNPQKESLANTGGVTQTRLPGSASPLLDKIPADSCATGTTLVGFTVTTDQRGVGRPQGNGCDIGAVEVVVPVAIVPKFTG